MRMPRLKRRPRLSELLCQARAKARDTEQKVALQRYLMERMQEERGRVPRGEHRELRRLTCQARYWTRRRDRLDARLLADIRRRQVDLRVPCRVWRDEDETVEPPAATPAEGS